MNQGAGIPVFSFLYLHRPIYPASSSGWLKKRIKRIGLRVVTGNDSGESPLRDGHSSEA